MRAGEGGLVVVQPSEGMSKGGNSGEALMTINGETLQTVDGVNRLASEGMSES